ncbi:MAG: hypothetical protein AAGB48_06205 [Planctomycetota bacterium]
MSAAEGAKLQDLLASITTHDAGTRPAVSLGIPSTTSDDANPNDPVLDELLWSYLVWEAGETKAAERCHAFAEQVIDLNELRVCLASEIVAMLGSRYPRVQERARRLRATLNDIFDRENAVTLAHLASLGKREAKAYLESLAEIPAYVAARVALLALGIHAFPLDERLFKAFEAAGVLPDKCSAENTSAWLERQIRAGDAAFAFHAVEAWSPSVKPKRGSTSRSSTTRKKAATKKAGTKKKPQTNKKSSGRKA